MKLITLTLSLFLLVSIQAQSSKKSLNADIWLRADNLTDTSTLWKDNNGNYRACPNSKKINVLKSSFNFNPAVKFDSTIFTVKNFQGIVGQYTSIVVYDAKMAQQEQGIWNVSLNNIYDLKLTSRRMISPQNITQYTDENIGFPVVNTTVQFWNKLPDESKANTITLGSGGQGLTGFEGSIAEFIGFNRIVSGIEMQMIQSYLAIKYGTTLLYTDYITSTGRVTWNYNLYKQYSYSIAGIGRDDAFSLSQKQGQYATEPDLLTIAAGKIADVNSNNTYTIKDGDFLVWGDNGFSFKVDTTTTGGDTSQYAIPLRKWLMNVNTNTASSISTQIQFNATNLTEKPKKCWLVIDRNGPGSFSVKNIEYVLADSIIQGKAWFNNIKWDTDKSGTDLFTFSCGNSGTMRKIGQQAEEPTNEIADKLIYSYKLYPNPSYGNYNLELNLDQVSDVTVRVISINGTMVREEKRKGADNYIFQGELPTGLYIIDVLTNKGKETFKLAVN